MAELRYRRVDWKYVLEGPFSYEFTARFFPAGQECIVQGEKYMITPEGIACLTGFGWDGPTGAPDYEGTMHAALVHDVLCRAIAEGRLSRRYRKRADLEFRRVLKRDGVPWLRRCAWWWAVRLYGVVSGHGRG